MDKLEFAPVIDVTSNPKLTSLSQLGSLRTTSFITIQNNAELLSLQGLDQLQTVKADIALYNNPKLTSLRGLESLRTVVGKISIHGHAGLTSLQGLNQIPSVGGLDFNDNAKLTSLSGQHVHPASDRKTDQRKLIYPIRYSLQISHA
ncbi:hypothetical protein BH09BAC4_BH09BAC4_00260 [soil metagenome]